MKKTIIGLCKSVIGATVLSFICFFLFNAIVRAIFKNAENINTYLYILNMITYTICFYFVRTEKLYVPFSSSSKTSIIDELKAYFRIEGKYLLFIYIFLSVLCEINYMIVTDTPGKLIVTLCSMCFPFSTSIKVPILRSIVSILVVMFNSTALAMYHSYKSIGKEN